MTHSHYCIHCGISQKMLGAIIVITSSVSVDMYELLLSSSRSFPDSLILLLNFSLGLIALVTDWLWKFLSFIIVYSGNRRKFLQPREVLRSHEIPRYPRLQAIEV